MQPNDFLFLKELHNETSRSICMNPSHAYVMVDDSFYETRAQVNQIKLVSNRKADREGPSADVNCDAIS